MWTSIDSYQCSVSTARREVTCRVMEQVEMNSSVVDPEEGRQQTTLCVHCGEPAWK
jgi:hypothetical protein